MTNLIQFCKISTTQPLPPQSESTSSPVSSSMLSQNLKQIPRLTTTLPTLKLPSKAQSNTNTLH